VSTKDRICEFCLATVISPKSIETMLEADSGGLFKDQNLWRVAQSFYREADARGESVALLFAVRDGAETSFSHWAMIKNIEVLDLPDSRGESRCYFDKLQPVNPIWEAIDSLSHKPSQEQLQREKLEGARTLRWPLQENQLHPYTICETPAFILAGQQPS
jgi:hypothetical protein